MGKLPSPNQLSEQIKRFFHAVGRFFVRVYQLITLVCQKVWAWIRVHIPLVEAIIQRHLTNPASVFVDAAITVLAIYLAFGISGAVDIYKVKSESGFAETLAELYPLPAARVGDSFIWSHEYLQRLRFLNTFSAQAPKSTTSLPPTDQQLRKQIMDGLIENQVLVLQAEKLGISVTTDDVNAAYAQQLQQTPDLETKIGQLYGMSVADFKNVLAESVLKTKVTSVVITNITVSHILTTTQDAANQAEQALSSGQSFAAVAKQFSQDANTKDNGGNLGTWTKGQLASQISPAFESTAFSLPLNKPSAPVQTQYGYHIIEVTAKTGNNYESYDDWYAQTLKSYSVSQYIGN